MIRTFFSTSLATLALLACGDENPSAPMKVPAWSAPTPDPSPPSSEGGETTGDGSSGFDADSGGFDTGEAGSTGTGNPQSETCQQPCASSDDCSEGEACVDASVGPVCLAQECETCFAEFGSCSFDTITCAYLDCELPVGTCSQECTASEECDDGQECFAFVDRSLCVPPGCDACGAGVSCNWDSVTCDPGSIVCG